MSDTELLRRIVALELAVDRLTVELSELKARPQQTYSFGGAGNWPFPWGTLNPATVIGSNDSPQTPKGVNGAAGPIGSAENPLIVKDR